MTQSAIWDALLVVGDCLSDGRLDQADHVLAELDAMDAWAWDGELRPAADDRIRRQLAKLAYRVRRFGGPEPSPYGHFGHGSIKLDGVDVPIFVDQDAPPGTIFLVNTSTVGGIQGRALYMDEAAARRTLAAYR